MVPVLARGEKIRYAEGMRFEVILARRKGEDMKTIDLAHEEHTLAELLTLAKRECVLIHSATGDDFLLEPADDFDREVAALGGSERFMSFLKDRSKEAGGRPLAEVRKKSE